MNSPSSTDSNHVVIDRDHRNESARLDDHSRVRVDKKLALHAAKKSARKNRIFDPRDTNTSRPSEELLLHLALALRAAKLSVEGFVGLELGRELVSIPLDGDLRHLGIQLLHHAAPPNEICESSLIHRHYARITAWH